jgi:hypothetical protein
MQQTGLVPKDKDTHTRKEFDKKQQDLRKQKHKWKPFKALSYQERKHLADKEAIIDHIKHVRKYSN